MSTALGETGLATAAVGENAVTGTPTLSPKRKPVSAAIRASALASETRARWISSALIPCPPVDRAPPVSGPNKVCATSMPVVPADVRS